MPDQAMHEDSHTHIGDSLGDLVDQKTRFRKTVWSPTCTSSPALTATSLRTTWTRRPCKARSTAGELPTECPRCRSSQQGPPPLIERVGGLAVSYIKTASGSSLPFAGTHAPLRAMRTSGHGRSR